MKRGWTIIEMAVVIGIIAILMMLVVPAVRNFVKYGEYNEVGTMVESIKAGAKYYDLKYGLSVLNAPDTPAGQATAMSFLKVRIPTNLKCTYKILPSDHPLATPGQKMIQVSTADSWLYKYDLPDGPSRINDANPYKKYITRLPS